MSKVWEKFYMVKKRCQVDVSSEKLGPAKPGPVGVFHMHPPDDLQIIQLLPSKVTEFLFSAHIRPICPTVLPMTAVAHTQNILHAIRPLWEYCSIWSTLLMCCRLHQAVYQLKFCWPFTYNKNLDCRLFINCKRFCSMLFEFLDPTFTAKEKNAFAKNGNCTKTQNIWIISSIFPFWPFHFHFFCTLVCNNPFKAECPIPASTMRILSDLMKIRSTVSCMPQRSCWRRSEDF